MEPKQFQIRIYEIQIIYQFSCLIYIYSFGMFHDTMKIGCHGRVGPITHIMTPTFVADTLKVSWSNCSRRYITHFLE